LPGKAEKKNGGGGAPRGVERHTIEKHRGLERSKKGNEHQKKEEKKVRARRTPSTDRQNDGRKERNLVTYEIRGDGKKKVDQRPARGMKQTDVTDHKMPKKKGSSSPHKAPTKLQKKKKHWAMRHREL